MIDFQNVPNKVFPRNNAQQKMSTISENSAKTKHVKKMANGAPVVNSSKKEDEIQLDSVIIITNDNLKQEEIDYGGGAIFKPDLSKNEKLLKKVKLQSKVFQNVFPNRKTLSKISDYHD